MRAGILRFASVVVFPVVDDRIKIEIDEKDVRTDVMRSGGAGGQHVNKTEFGGALDAYPDQHVVKCQTGPLAAQEPRMAWNMLRAKLFEAEMHRREDKAVADQATKTDIGWGHQIRSYVLQPYQMVKDLRTGLSDLRHRRRARRRPRSVHAGGAGAEGVRRRAGDGGGCGVTFAQTALPLDEHISVGYIQS